MSITTFQVSELPVSNKSLDVLNVGASVGEMLHYPVEAFGLSHLRLVCCNDANPFATAARMAFYQHYPLTISPDDVWFCIAQGFAQHVNLHAEELRGEFVRHEGKKKLEVTRADFELGRENPWPEVFTALSEQIGAQVGQGLRDLIVADFSTTAHFHRAATDVALMDAFQPYFEYEMMIGCGIPAITLLGNVDDWRELRRRASGLARYGLHEWVKSLLPVLDQVVETASGRQDRGFWNSFFRFQSGSGGEALTGWIHVLFPYLKHRGEARRFDGTLESNPYLKTWEQDCAHAINSRGRKARSADYEEISGPSLLEIPAAIASAPVRLVDARRGKSHDMRFAAGMFGVVQDSETGSLAPAFGWAIVYDKPMPRVERDGLRRMRFN